MPLRRSWLHRSISALCAVWLAFIVAEPAALHSCPMHGGHGAAAAAAALTGLDATAGNHHSAVAEHEHGAPANHEQNNRYCSCVGQCNATGAVAAVPVPAVRLTDVVVRELRVTLPSRDAQPNGATEHLLPFANGPPRA